MIRPSFTTGPTRGSLQQVQHWTWPWGSRAIAGYRNQPATTVPPHPIVCSTCEKSRAEQSSQPGEILLSCELFWHFVQFYNFSHWEIMVLWLQHWLGAQESWLISSSVSGTPWADQLIPSDFSNAFGNLVFCSSKIQSPICKAFRSSRDTAI